MLIFVKMILIIKKHHFTNLINFTKIQVKLFNILNNIFQLTEIQCIINLQN